VFRIRPEPNEHLRAATAELSAVGCRRRRRRVRCVQTGISRRSGLIRRSHETARFDCRPVVSRRVARFERTGRVGIQADRVVLGRRMPRHELAPVTFDGPDE